LNLIEHPLTSATAVVSPGYVAQPAPMGLADFGLGGNPYSYSTEHFLATVSFNAPPNMTDPGSYTVIDPGASRLGHVGSVYEFGLQLNTVQTNVSIPGTDQGVFWTQNVLNVNDTGIHFVDDVFNFSSGSGFFIPATAPATIVSGCGTSDLGTLLAFDGGVYQCVGSSIPITSANYPLTIQLYNNATVNGQNNDQVAFGYRIIGAGGLSLTGVYDTVVFNNPHAPSQAPPNPAGFTVSGTTAAPVGLLEDSEVVLVGQIGGSNAVFRSLNGSLTLQYSNASSGGWRSVPSAYNFGADTGETSTGIAGYWTGSTEQVHQGPSMLYGLWGAVPHVSVASGAIQFQGSITPSYGFVFVSNQAPNVLGSNFSWVPTTATGAFDTWLPPAVPPSTQYYVQSFAAASQELNSSPFSTPQANYAIVLASAPGVLRAPLYMMGNAQAAALALAVAGSSSTPYNFHGLTVNMNFTFNHINDLGFPSFVLFSAEGVTAGLDISSVRQGSDSIAGNFYISDGPPAGPHGLLAPPPAVYGSLGAYTDQIQVFDCAGANVSSEVLVGLNDFGSLQGGAIFLWHDTHAHVANINNSASYGIVVGDSLATSINNLEVISGGNGVDDVGSSGTTVTGVQATDFGSLGVYGLSSTGGSYSWINATTQATGVYAGADFGSALAYYAVPGLTSTSISELNATNFALGANISYSSHVSFTDVGAFSAASSIAVDVSLGTTVTHLAAYGARGVDLFGAIYTNLTDLRLSDPTGAIGTYGMVWDGSDHTSLTNAWFTEYFWAERGFYDSNTNLANVWDNGTSTYVNFAGLVLLYATGTTATNLYSTYANFSYELDYGSGGTISGVTADTDQIGFNVYFTSGVSVSNVLVNESSFTIFHTGVQVAGGSSNTVSGVRAESRSVGVLLDDGASGNTISTVTAQFDSYGVQIESSPDNSVSGVATTTGSVGVLVDPSPGVTISNVDASGQSVGVQLNDTWSDSVSGTTATGLSVGVWISGSNSIQVSSTIANDLSIGVLVYRSGQVSISGVTASNTTLSNPWGAQGVWGYPIAAVVTFQAYQVSIANVVATTYPAALYDFDSGTGFSGPGSLSVENLNATGSDYAVILNETEYGFFNDLGAYQDWQGVQINDGFYNDVTMGSFVADASYGVAISSGEDNYVWNSNFLGDNGATSTYNAAHLQAFSANYNYFDDPSTGYLGNYWADWHSYNQYGYLNPYFVSGNAWDYYPLGVWAGQYAVYFYATGLSGGVPWSVTFNGVTETTSATWLLFGAVPGTYAFSVPSVAGYTVNPPSGSGSTTTGPASVNLTYTAVYNITLTESGLPAGTGWSAIVNGLTATGASATLAFSAPSGTFAYQVEPVAGYTASPSHGSLTVAGAAYTLAVTFTAVTYAVTLTESGLPSGTSWSATVNGATQSSTGTSVTFYLTNGTYAFSFENVSGFTLSGGRGALTVLGSPVSEAAGFAPSSTPSLVSSNTYNSGFAIALAIAVIALLVGLLALFWRRKKEPTTAPPEAWTPPSAAASSTAVTSPRASPATGANDWSEEPANPPS